MSNIKKFNVDNLSEDIARITLVDKERAKKEIIQYIWPRLDLLHSDKEDEDRYYILEEDYVETEWKDMISIHYINTSYHVDNSVIRIHLFLEDEVEDDAYIGFFTLRKINEPRVMLSYIYPNWEKIEYLSEKVYVMTYKKYVHISGKEIGFHTYPLFVQDNSTVACAQADIIAMSKYLHNKFDYNKIRIADMVNSYTYQRTKIFPTNGLNAVQMLQVFDTYNIPIRYTAFKNKPNMNTEEITAELKSFKDYIDYSVESAIPVLLGVSLIENDKLRKHVVQIIGHTSQAHDNYVIYDDSGVFLNNVVGEKGFVGAVNWDKLKKIIALKTSFIICPIHEKVYLYHEDIERRLTYQIYNINNLKNLVDKNIIKKIRYVLVDNRQIKHFLAVIMEFSNIESVKKEISKLLMHSMPHYVWYCEIPLKEGYFIYIADPTYNRATLGDVFLNDIPIYSDEQLALLDYK